MSALPRVIDVIPRVQLRGAEIFAQQLEASLRDRYEPRLMPLFKRAADRRANLPAGPPLDIEPGVAEGPVRALRATRSLRSRARRCDPAIVVAHGGDPLRYSVAARLHRLAPLVYIRIAAVTPDLRTSVRTRSLMAAYGKVTAFVAVSESLRRELLDVFDVPPDAVRVIPNGRPQPPAVEGERRRSIRNGLGVGDEDVLVIWVGRFVPEKDPGALVGLADRLARIAPQVKLVAVGDGPLFERTRASARGTDRLIFTGEREEAAELISAADLLVSTSKTEGAPGVFIEALLAGVPVICHDMGGVRDVVSEETGALVPPGDLDALTGAVADLANDPLARGIRARAAAAAARRFDIQVVADRFDALYREILAN